MKAYDEAMARAKKALEVIATPTRKVYDEVKAQAWRDYKEAMDQALKEAAEK